jgi:diacylglycerol kinase (ATP)
MNDLRTAPNPLGELSPVVFVNYAAGGNRTRRHLPKIQKLFESVQLNAQFVVTQSTAELESCAKSAIDGKHRLLFAMGGDGTFQGLVNAAFGADVILGVLPSGGGNDFAAALGLPDNPVEAAQALVQGTTRLVDAAKVKTYDGRTRLYVGGGGLGIDSDAARYASGPYRSLPGRFRYIASALRALAEHTPFELRIEFPGTALAPHESKGLVAAVLNTPTYGAGVRLAPQAVLDDGLLDIVAIEDLSKLEVLVLLPRLTGSGELRTSRLKRWRSHHVRLTASRPCLFQGDGEIIGSVPVEVEVLPRAIRVLAPVTN